MLGPQGLVVVGVGGDDGKGGATSGGSKGRTVGVDDDGVGRGHDSVVGGDGVGIVSGVAELLRSALLGLAKGRGGFGDFVVGVRGVRFVERVGVTGVRLKRFMADVFVMKIEETVGGLHEKVRGVALAWLAEAAVDIVGDDGNRPGVGVSPVPLTPLGDSRVGVAEALHFGVERGGGPNAARGEVRDAGGGVHGSDRGAFGSREDGAEGIVLDVGENFQCLVRGMREGGRSVF